MKKEYLALFDLDGTLFDTSEVNYFAYKDALEPFGIKLQKKFLCGRMQWAPLYGIPP